MILRVVILAPAHQKNRDTSQQLTNQIASQLSQFIRCLDLPDRAPNGSVTGYQVTLPLGGILALRLESAGGKM